jgi:hypothetical protein
VSRIPCSMCRRPSASKMASAYWAWFRADGERTAWKLHYCLECAAGALSVLSNASSQLTETSDVFACVACGASAETDSDPMWCTLYLPGKDRMELALQLDTACAAKLRIPITQNGSRLPDRNAQLRGPSTSTSAWDALGLSPQ